MTEISAMVATRHDITRTMVEDFLYQEAALLDEWRLEEWLLLLSEDIIYEIPIIGMEQSSSDQTLFLLADDAQRLRGRVKQLMGTATWAESPRSRTRRMISNVRVRDAVRDELNVSANFAVYRIPQQSWRTEDGSNQTECFVGAYHYKLRSGETGLRIARRTVVLDVDVIRPHGKISIIL
ncbi:MAG: aromatic-ring-hydroxylating dioxygenase subunit beta [Proteobacteria bacterium]|nr:aromatic-ring-hydroxylating dioxygenase subunit beta [Pseudomonadota bacterium]